MCGIEKSEILLMLIAKKRVNKRIKDKDDNM